MAIRTRSAKSAADESKDAAPQDNRLDLMDQAFYMGHRAAGQREVMQVGWMYDRPIDMEKLATLERNLSTGWLGRRVERSPLPFGRDRWVADHGPGGLAVATTPRPREELAAWMDECAQRPLDPEHGPTWRLSVVEFTDGTSAVNLTMSHYIADGIGMVMGVSQMVMGDTSGGGYPEPQSRTPLRAVLQDLGETLRDIPSVGRALVAGVKEARRRRGEEKQAPPVAQASEAATAADADLDAPMVMPNLWVLLSLPHWTDRAQALGGTANTLAVAVTARIDELMGRPHGSTTKIPVMLLVNKRTQGDTRALAVAFARLHIDTAAMTTDLTDTRTAVRDGLTAQKNERDDSTALMALTPFTPKKAWKKLTDYALADPEAPAICSNLGDIGPAIAFIDGAPATHGLGRGTSAHLTRRWLQRMGSQLQVHFGIVKDTDEVWLSVQAYQDDSVTDRAQLRGLVERTLDEFGLTGKIY